MGGGCGQTLPDAALVAPAATPATAAVPASSAGSFAPVAWAVDTALAASVLPAAAPVRPLTGLLTSVQPLQQGEHGDQEEPYEALVHVQEGIPSRLVSSGGDARRKRGGCGAVPPPVEAQRWPRSPDYSSGHRRAARRAIRAARHLVAAQGPPPRRQPGLTGHERILGRPIASVLADFGFRISDVAFAETCPLRDLGEALPGERRSARHPIFAGSRRSVASSTATSAP